MIKTTSQGDGELPPGEMQATARTQDDRECAVLCGSAASACPSLVNNDICVSNCPNFNSAQKEALAAMHSCEDLAKTPELPALIDDQDI